jgi:spore germination protein GerM
VLPAFLVVLLVSGGLLLWYFMMGQAPSSPGASRKPARTVTLYFAAANGAGLVAETREISNGLTEEEWLKATVQALIDGPTGELVAVFPRQTVVRGVTVVGSELQVDFSRELADAHPGGSWGELLTIQSLANTVAISFPHLRQVRILIEGAAAETLKGHVDLRQPVSPDFTLVLKAPPNAAATTPAGKAQ